METTRRGFLRGLITTLAVMPVAKAAFTAPSHVKLGQGFRGQEFAAGGKRFFYGQAGASGWECGDFVYVDGVRISRITDSRQHIIGVAVARVEPSQYGFIQTYGPAFVRFTKA